MPIIAKDSSKASTPAPEGLWQGVCVDVEDLGVVDTPFGPKAKIKVVWELGECDPATGRRYVVHRLYTLSLNEKSSLRQDLESWRGKPFTPEQIRDGFDLETLLGANGQLSVVHGLGSKGGTFANVQTIVPLGRGMVKIQPSPGYVRAKDRPDANGRPAAAPPEQDDVDDGTAPF